MKKHQLPEQDSHVVSYSIHGNIEGPTIISFHGGPGSKSKPYHAERYDLKKYRVILFDQRGCGDSTPLGSLENNTTEDLLNDAERIREELGIESWFVSGGSWGSTLSLLYALKYPERTKGLLLSAIFLGDRDSINWSFGESGASVIMPDVWERRMEFFKKFNINVETQNEDILKALDEADSDTKKEITAGIFDWEGNLFTPHSAISYSNPDDLDEKDIASAKIFIYYDKNHEFIPDNYILDNIEKITDIPTVIVHGRYDILCPMNKAKMLVDKLKNCTFVIATSSGHKLTPEGETIQYIAYDRFLSGNT
jgi:proline iminopeptidase